MTASEANYQDSVIAQLKASNAHLQDCNVELTIERNAALDEASKASAERDELLALRLPFTRISELEAECERLRAALREVRDWFWNVAGQDKNEWVQKLDHVLAAAAGAPAPAEPTVTREQVEREIADDCDVLCAQAETGPTGDLRYREGWCEALSMFERRIRSGAYRKTSEAAPAAVQGPSEHSSATLPDARAHGSNPETGEAVGRGDGVSGVHVGSVLCHPASPPAAAEVYPGCAGDCSPAYVRGVAEDRSEPPPGYDIYYWHGPVPSLEGCDQSMTRDDAVTACWSHRDAVGMATAKEAREHIARLNNELADARTRIERALAVARHVDSTRPISDQYDLEDLAALLGRVVAALEDKP